MFAVGKDHPLATKSEIKKEDLIGQTMICYRRETPIAEQIDERLVGVENLQRIEVGGFEMVKLMVKNNWGFSIISKLALGNETRSIQEDYEVIPFPEIDKPHFNLTGIYKKDSPKLKNLHLFLQHFETILKRYYGISGCRNPKSKKHIVDI